jgi:ABC-2 type transport system ATP-binding protein
MEPVLATHDLTKVYDERAVVDHLNWRLSAGAACALLGPNGAGKTTTLRMLMGFTPPSLGRSDLFGADGWDPSVEVRRRVAFVSDQPVLPAWMRVDELIRFHSSLYPRWDANRERELRSLFELAPRARIGTLSKGQHQRLMLALALCQNSDLLLLDEPASGLDVEVRRSFLGLLGEYLGQGERSLVFSTHLLTDVERIATRVLLLFQGRAIEDCELDALQEDIRLVTLSRELRDRTRETWESAGILAESTSNGSVSLTVRHFRGAASELAASLPASSIEAVSLPFEDIYLALTRAARERQPC